MKTLRMTYARSAGFAALLGLASTANAQPPINPIYNFCPTTHYYITCSFCTMKLTCDVNGPTITIYGSAVKLDGNGRTMSFAQGTAVKVIGAVATISNLNISRPQGHGIDFARTATRDYGNVENVTVSWPGLDGITRVNGNTSLTLRNTRVYMASNFGVNNTITRYGRHSVDMFDSDVGQGLYGFGSVGAARQQHARNQYFENAYTGVEEHGDYNNGYYSDSYFYYNKRGIIVSNNGTYPQTLTGNVGYGNSSVDCFGMNAVRLIAANNSWTTNQGCVNKP